MAITLEKKIFRICRGALYISFPLTANGNKIMGKNKSFVKRFLKTEWRNNFFSKNQIASDYWWPPEKCRGVKVWQTRDCEKYIILQCEAVYIGINLSSFWGEKPRLRSRYTVKLQDRFLRKFNIYIYIYIYTHDITGGHSQQDGHLHNYKSWNLNSRTWTGSLHVNHDDNSGQRNSPEITKTITRKSYSPSSETCY